jgi:hypothetical protein
MCLLSPCLANKTKDVAERMNEMTDKLWREIMLHDERCNYIIDDYQIRLKNPAALSLVATAERRLPLALDLKSKVLINRTPTRFITSDRPVVKYNQYLEKTKHPGGNVELFTNGPQVFLSNFASSYTSLLR